LEKLEAAGKKKVLLLIWDNARAGMSPGSSGAGSVLTTEKSRRAEAA